MSDDKTVFQPKAAPSQGSLRPGVRLNGMFEIEQLIAEGGMGEVYKGVAVASGDAVAIKLVRPDMARDPDVLALFRREAAVLHDLQHDAIVRYYVFSLDPELQRFYIAMEFVDGVSLQKRLADGPLDGPQARILLRRIGGALEKAHGRGVIHRDISSDNIILPGGDVRNAKIVDFGIARAVRPGEGTILGGGFAGKFNYVSPEQLGLFGGEVTPKSDIYSFGLVIAEALRGKPLVMDGTQVEVIEKRRTVPDLSGVDVSLRPLLTAMLAPDPKDRPENMAEVAAWGEGSTIIRPPEPPPPPVAAKRGNGRLLAAAAGVAVLAIGAAIYFLRDDIGLGGKVVVAPTEAPTPVATAAALPPLPSTTPSPPPVPSTPQPTATSATLEPRPTETPPTPPSPAKTTPQPHPVTVGDLLNEMPPGAPSPQMSLAPATVGAPYRAELPPFTDPSGKGLTLHATPLPPAGLTFHDLGGGRAEIVGEPAAAAEAGFDIVATTQAGKSAHMKVALSVRANPKVVAPTPSQSVVDLQPATAGAQYSAGLPPFRSAVTMTLRAGQGLPEGLTLHDLGKGLSELSGAPKTPGQFAFDVVAATAAGAEGRMQVRISVAPAAAPPAPQPTETPQPTQAPPPTPQPTQAPQPTVQPTQAPQPTVQPTQAPPAKAPPVVSAVDFVRDYSGACFAARLKDDDPANREITAFGADHAEFETFAAAFEKAVRVEPDLRGLLVLRSQCPAVDFLKSAATAPKGLPRIVLDSPTVGKGRPLSGTILGLAGRSLLLLVVDDDGKAFRLRAQSAPDGGSATFTTNVTGDPSSIGKPQLIIAVASDRPVGEGRIVDAPSSELMPKLAAEGRDAGAGAAAALFKFAE